MSWDDLADDAAVRHHAFESMTGEDNERIRYGFWNGAKWQREQLRTDEAVERVAAGVHKAADHFGHYTPWAKLPEHVQEDWRRPARAAIDALLGEYRPNHTTHHADCGCV